MNAQDVVSALHLPEGARVDRRVPKKLLVENGAPSAADKRRVNDEIQEIRWLAVLKPNTIGVPEYRDSVRRYSEIAVLSAILRGSAHVTRLSSIIHRAVPYPVFLILEHDESLVVSLVHKRWSHATTNTVVAEDVPFVACIESSKAAANEEMFLVRLALEHQTRPDLLGLYQSWVDTVVALLIARVTGVFSIAGSPEQAETLRDALAEYEGLAVKIRALRAAAKKERQTSRQVELNLQLQHIRDEYLQAQARLRTLRTP